MWALYNNGGNMLSIDISLLILSFYCKPVAPMMFFYKSRLMPIPGFIFILLHLTFITHALRHNTLFAHTLIFDIFSHLQTHIILHGGPPKWFWLHSQVLNLLRFSLIDYVFFEDVDLQNPEL